MLVASHWRRSQYNALSLRRRIDWGLRDYGLATWGGGDAGCEHDVGGQVQDNKAPGAITSGVRPGAGNVCRKCGAIRHDAGIGLEPTLDAYIENMRAVGRELWRVLRLDGTLFLNLGDCYNGSGGAGGDYNKGGLKEGQPKFPGRHLDSLKPKDLVGLPWRVAFALQADGWWLRSDIIWHKPNPMPESVTDRPTRAHEYVFLLTKQARYYYDNDAVRESAKYGRREQPADTWSRTGTGDKDAVRVSGATKGGDPSAGRNRRTVWTIPTQPYKGAHFATFPEKLVEPCILAGTSPKACGVCGAPWERDITRKANYEKREQAHQPGNTPSKVDSTGWKPPTVTDGGWRPTCTHNDDTGSCLVLDPFCGSGTVGVVARRFGRRFVGCDLSADYLRLATERIGAETQGMAL